ncbi:hypothetical protein LX36DRAFT_178323 [Colletotrichum falcatum]|nr:hypothetical protein LX36DRAFT_178323 [Colletotrichum falcatum]
MQPTQRYPHNGSTFNCMQLFLLLGHMTVYTHALSLSLSLSLLSFSFSFLIRCAFSRNCLSLSSRQDVFNLRFGYSRREGLSHDWPQRELVDQLRDDFFHVTLLSVRMVVPTPVALIAQSLQVRREVT